MTNPTRLATWLVVNHNLATVYWKGSKESKGLAGGALMLLFKVYKRHARFSWLLLAAYHPSSCAVKHLIFASSGADLQSP